MGTFLHSTLVRVFCIAETSLATLVVHVRSNFTNHCKTIVLSFHAKTPGGTYLLDLRASGMIATNGVSKKALLGFNCGKIIVVTGALFVFVAIRLNFVVPRLDSNLVYTAAS